uniref:LRRCT domain-containing protein n=1 Tax=Timema douglasi TaxID=61478 RepID=A0A7R8VW04_TIMDO|nr:unnamed protein product [Timema douglasi]
MCSYFLPDTLGNLSALRVLDISHNDLTDFPPKIFGPPPKLTTLYMSHNKLTKLPVEELLSLKTQLKLLDVRENNLNQFSYQLMPLVENGTVIQYSDNPLECDCLVRPLRRWFSVQIAPEESWEKIECSGPEFLAGKSAVHVPEEHMTCANRGSTKGDSEFAISPDIKFRDVHKLDDGTISATWYVTTREDVGDFYVVVRDLTTGAARGQQNEALVYEQDVPYTSRSHVLHALPSGDQLQLCVLARDSEGSVRRWRSSQCRELSPGALSSTSPPTLRVGLTSLLGLLYFVRLAMAVFS